MSLEALIVALLPASGTVKEDIFYSNQAPDCHQMVLCLCRWRAGSPAILHVDWRLQRVPVSAQLSLKSHDVFPNVGNTHLP